MTFEALFLAAVGGVVEAIVGKSIKAGPALARRTKVLAMVEQQDLDEAERAVRAAVEAAREKLLETYAGAEEALQSGAVQDLVALLNHPPFAEEVSRKLLFQGIIPDFDRLRQAYLDQDPERSSARWQALEPYLVEFFDLLEVQLLADRTLGPLLRHLRTLAVHLRMADDIQIIAKASRIVADATRQLPPLQRRTAQAAESAAGDLSRLLQLAGQQNTTLGQVLQVLKAIATRLGASGPGTAGGTSSLTPREAAYLRLLRRECNRLPLAEESRAAGEPGQAQAELANVYVDLLTDVPPDLEQVFERLGVPGPDRPALREAIQERLKRRRRDGPPELMEARGVELLLGAEREELDTHPLRRYVQDGEELRAAVQNLTAQECLLAHRTWSCWASPAAARPPSSTTWPMSVPAGSWARTRAGALYSTRPFPSPSSPCGW